MRNYLYIIVIGCALCSCSRIQERKQSNTQQPPLPVEVLLVGDDSEAGLRTFVGEIKPAAELPVYYALGGQLLRIHVKSGDVVKKGAPIADFDDTQARALHQAAKAVLQQAQDGYKRLEQVHEKGVLSEVKWIEMQTNLEKAIQNERASAKSVRDCHLTAPLDGIIGEISVHEGQQLFPGQAVCNLLNISSFSAEFTVPEQDIRFVQIGDSANVHVSATETDYLALVSKKNMTANALAHTYAVQAEMDGATNGLLPGMSCRVSMVIGQPQQAIVIPGKCIQTTPNGPSVWVVEQGVAQRRLIEVARYVADGVEVKSGLKPRDKVVVAGQQKLYNGCIVEERY